jgi:hypothetical protein
MRTFVFFLCLFLTLVYLKLSEEEQSLVVVAIDSLLREYFVIVVQKSIC